MGNVSVLPYFCLTFLYQTVYQTSKRTGIYVPRPSGKDIRRSFYRHFLVLKQSQLTRFYFFRGEEDGIDLLPLSVCLLVSMKVSRQIAYSISW